MFKEKEFETWIGFKQNKYILLLILITGITFPFIFLKDTFAGYIKYGFINPIIGIIYASILIIGNLIIFYKLKNTLQKKGNFHEQNYLARHFAIHMLFTLVASFLMSTTPYFILGLTGTVEYVLRNLIGSGLLICILAGFYEALFFKSAYQKSIIKQEELKRKNVESQLEVLKNQVKPHFLFNSLNTLASIIPDDPEQAVKYVHNLSNMYRYVLEIKNKKLIPLQEELNCVKAYLFMLSIRYGNHLKFEIEEDELDLNMHIVPLSLQLLVENAVKHNIISKSKPLKIYIDKNGVDTLLVSNNLQPKFEKPISTGIGLENIKNRYQIIANRKVEVKQDEYSFKVYLPLIKVI